MVDEGEEPDQDVGEGIDEHEAELSMDPVAMLVEMTLQRWRWDFAKWGSVSVRVDLGGRMRGIALPFVLGDIGGVVGL